MGPLEILKPGGTEAAQKELEEIKAKADSIIKEANLKKDEALVRLLAKLNISEDDIKDIKTVIDFYGLDGRSKDNKPKRNSKKVK